MQAVHDDAPADDEYPTGHVVHSDAPKTLAYVPGVQGMQVVSLKSTLSPCIFSM